MISFLVQGKDKTTIERYKTTTRRLSRQIFGRDKKTGALSHTPKGIVKHICNRVDPKPQYNQIIKT